MQHWEVLSNGGVTVSNSPETLWNAAVKYFKWCEENPIETKGQVNVGKKAGEQITSETTRPYSIKGFCLHAGLLEEYIRDIYDSKDSTSDYYAVMSRIMYVIDTQNIEYATVGLFNSVFVTKMMNLEQGETSNKGVTVNIIGGERRLARSEQEVLDDLEVEKSILKIQDLESGEDLEVV